LDAIACRLLYPVLVRESQTPASLLALETWLAGVMARMQLRGMTVDVERLDAIAEAAGAACGRAEAALVELIDLTPRQGVKLREWFEANGVDFAAHRHPTTKGGAPSLDEDAVKAMFGYPLSDTARRVCELLLEYKAHENQQSKAREMQAYIAESFDGRLHPEVDPIGTITARMTAKAPNVQNFSKADPTMRATLLPMVDHGAPRKLPVLTGIEQCFDVTGNRASDHERAASGWFADGLKIVSRRSAAARASAARHLASASGSALPPMVVTVGTRRP
jgi:hypothetical protein